ncbi:DNA-binding protein [Sulfolobus islandicus]|uniref:Sulfolobus plasmid regulatory PlrA like protein n=1 Tax=Saccharolobus islandicus (strain HVE10/4) TaxID=930943 RepID=F0NRC1_SACI0|nr:DNA-binding protein [Sulfolobus islandicus]ADX82922.1 Sulfolobus plasmid regulatory PlrA like protein [Sulfolobus islandicus HVE10/4]WCM38285.1 DNA-binding protein [Sulfolobus islandicus]
MEREFLERFTLSELILLSLSRRCMTVEELQNKTGADKNSLLVYLTRLHKRGIITRHWRKIAGIKVREYCLKYREELIS